jgi:hypothetical protein
VSAYQPSTAWKDELGRFLAEKKRYAGLAVQARRNAVELRRRRDFLEAMLADSSAREYRKLRDDHAAEARKIRAAHNLKNV